MHTNRHSSQFEDRRNCKAGTGTQAQSSQTGSNNLREDFVYLNDTAFARFSDAAGLLADVNRVHGQLYWITSLASAGDMRQVTAHAQPVVKALGDVVGRTKALQGLAASDMAGTTAEVEAYAKAA